MTRPGWRLRCLLAATCVALITSAGAQDKQELETLLAQINDQIDKPMLTVATFTQHNHIKVLQAPLISTGEVFIDARTGVAWYVNQPLQSKLIINDRGIDTGQGLVSSSRTIARLLRALISGELSTLPALFTITGEKEGSQWTLLLTPKDPLLARRIQSLRLSGANSVAQLEVMQPTGNRIVIVFNEPSALTELPTRVYDDLYATVP